MADVYTTITEVDQAVLESLALILELRAADPQQVAMRVAYQGQLRLSPSATVAEVGCGTGAVARSLAVLYRSCRVIGLDPSDRFIEHARRLARELPNLEFCVGEATCLPFANASLDAIVFHTTLCHIPELALALAEARRVLRPGGALAVFDADYSSTNVATGEIDPLQACVAACVQAIVHHPFLVHQLAPAVRRAGFEIRSFQSLGYNGVSDAQYLLTIIDRGADALAADGRITRQLAEALKTEARHRERTGTFFGHLAYAALIATRPSEK